MSYCRLSEDSDVYVFANVKGIAITTAYDKRVRINGTPTQTFNVDGPMKALTVLALLQRRGLRVPQTAIDRLKREARP